jgi:effector-binding domain-containing protein
MSYQCESKFQEAQTVLSIRTKTTGQDLVLLFGRVYDQILQYLDSQGEKPSGDAFIAYYNVDMQDLDIEIGFPVSRSLPAKGEIQPRVIPAGRVATCHYTGPYGKMAPACEVLETWIKENGFKSTGMLSEVFLNSPAEVPLEELKTQIVFWLADD